MVAVAESGDKNESAAACLYVPILILSCRVAVVIFASAYILYNYLFGFRFRRVIANFHELPCVWGGGGGEAKEQKKGGTPKEVPKY